MTSQKIKLIKSKLLRPFVSLLLELLGHARLSNGELISKKVKET